MKPRRFYEYVEKDPHKVTILWKLFHILIFAMISVNSMVVAYNFGVILDIFNYRCILFAKPSFRLVDTQKFGTGTNDTNSSVNANASSAVSVSPSSAQALVHLLFGPTEAFDYDDQLPKKIPNTDDYYVINREIYFVNETLRGKVKMRMMHTVFATLMMCNLGYFIPLFSFMVSSALMAFVMFCGRGGRALANDPFPSPWLFVYPVLIISIVMCVLYGMTTKIVNDGLDVFCRGFKEYTGGEGCNRYMNFFTTQQLAGHRQLWEKIFFCYIFYPSGAILWMLQFILTVFRVLNLADFDFKMVVIVPEKANWTREDEEIELVSHPTATPQLYEVMKLATAKRNAEKVKKV